MPTDSSMITLAVLEVFAFFVVLAYASLESRRKERRARAKAEAGRKLGQNLVKPKA